jgi:SHS2 domain-containing protein
MVGRPSDPGGDLPGQGAGAGCEEPPGPGRDLRSQGLGGGPDDVPVPGVRGLEHTADVGLEVEAPDLPELFRRAALGATWLVLEGEVGGEGAGESRMLQLAEEDLPALLRSWLRSLLFWQETEGFAVTEASVTFGPVPLCSSPDGQAFGLRARVEGRVHEGPWVREIKGVTLHGLETVRRGEGWYGRVIFDV